ncbi:MAG TPA: Calx-beta domain-containing protein [Candidatus Limnocylindrales bacterium]|nr:Calx-beta domain-containing protein [Candidatus Limnocylindrales bacterium]
MKIPFPVLFAGFLAFTSLPAVAQVSVWTYHNDNRRTGLNTNETILNLTNVNATTFGKLFSYAVDGYVYAQPLYVPNLNIQGRGTHNVFFIATEHNTVYAFDADSAGAAGGLLWKTNLGAAAVTTVPGVFTNKNFGARYNNNAYTDIEPEVGITGTPVIDTNSGTLYVDAFTGEVGGGVTNYFHRLHALNLTNGTERSFSPVVVTAAVAGTGVDSVGGRVTFNAKQENQRCALTLAGRIVYLAYAGYADTDPYHGWVIGFNATNLVQLTNYVFNTTPNSTIAAYGGNAAEGGIWMGGGGLSVDDNINLFFEVGNGIFNVTNNSGKTEYGDSFMKLSTTNGLAVADYFTPWNQFTLQANDTDLGSGGLLILPDQPGSFPHLLVGAGKEGKIYLINRDQLTTGNNHFDSTNSIDFIVQSLASRIKGSFDTPAYFNGRIYYAGNGDNLKAFTLTNGLMSGVGVLTNTARTFSFPGATPVISANGTNSGIVWALQMGTPAVLVAGNATNFITELYNSSQAAGNRDKLANGTKFALPTVADGKVFVGSSNSVSVFGLLAGTFSFGSAAYSVQEANTNATITVNRIGGTNGAVQVSYATIAGGTATNGVDYTSVSGALNWTNGESAPKTFTVPILNDGQAGPNETVNLALSNPTNNSALGVPSTAVLIIIEPPTSVWKLAHFGTNANNAVASDSADADHDGAVNLLEYAFATDPNVANSNSFTGNLVGKQFQLHFPRNTSASDITCIVQTSDTLTTWSNLMTYTAASGWLTNLAGASVFESSSNGVPPDQYVNVTVITSTNVTTAGLLNQFLRLQVHR